MPDVVGKSLTRGDLDRDFARIRYDDCAHEHLLAFSCKGRRFCAPATMSLFTLPGQQERACGQFVAYPQARFTGILDSPSGSC